MKPALYDIPLQRGGTGAFVFRPRAAGGGAFDHTGSTWRLLAGEREPPLVDKTGAVDGEGYVRFAFTEAEIDGYPDGLTYRIRRAIGAEAEIWITGRITLAGQR